tara:strand:- start:7318 stop:7554 length:237 start_codon:yes stop_codon:yes gene_type:complete
MQSEHRRWMTERSYTDKVDDALIELEFLAKRINRIERKISKMNKDFFRVTKARSKKKKGQQNKYVRKQLVGVLDEKET